MQHGQDGQDGQYNHRDRVDHLVFRTISDDFWTVIGRLAYDEVTGCGRAAEFAGWGGVKAGTADWGNGTNWINIQSSLPVRIFNRKRDPALIEAAGPGSHRGLA